MSVVVGPHNRWDGLVHRCCREDEIPIRSVTMMSLEALGWYRPEVVPSIKADSFLLDSILLAIGLHVVLRPIYVLL